VALIGIIAWLLQRVLEARQPVSDETQDVHSMIRLALAALFTLCAGSAYAEPRRTLVLDGGDGAPVTLPLPAEVTIVECGGEAILNFYCLRTEGAREAAVLSELSAGIVAHGWAMLGEGKTTTRPYTYAFERPRRGSECPLLFMITSDTRTQPGRPSLAAGSVEIQLAKTADIRCIFG
jgi:hypothetical protein